MRIASLVVAAAAMSLGFVDATVAPRPVSLTVTIVGHGAVQVGTTGRVECPFTCRKTYRVAAGLLVTLRAQTTRNWKLVEWRGGCIRSTPTCSVHVRRSMRVVVVFLAPGRRGNPNPLGSTYDLDHETGDYTGWRLTVLKTHFEPPEYFSVLLTAQPISGTFELLPLVSNIYLIADGASNLVQNGCGQSTPAPTLLSKGVRDFGGLNVVPDGLAVTGYVCFQIGSVDPRTLTLVTEPPLSTPSPRLTPSAAARWFALH